MGKHVANNSLFIEIAISFWAFSIANVKGQELDADVCLDEGIVVSVGLFHRSWLAELKLAQDPEAIRDRYTTSLPRGPLGTVPGVRVS